MNKIWGRTVCIVLFDASLQVENAVIEGMGEVFARPSEITCTSSVTGASLGSFCGFEHTDGQCTHR